MTKNDFLNLLPAKLITLGDGVVILVAGNGHLLGSFTPRIWFEEIANHLALPLKQFEKTTHGVKQIIDLLKHGEPVGAYFERLKKLIELNNLGGE